MAEKIMVAKRPHLGPDGRMLKRGDAFSVTPSQEREYERMPHLAEPDYGQSPAGPAVENSADGAAAVPKNPPATRPQSAPATARPAPRASRPEKPRRGGKMA